MFIVLRNDNDGILNELIHVGIDRVVAENHFLGACAINLSNWDEYTSPDREAVLDDGYAEFGGGCVMFIDTSNCVSDNELAAEICGFPPKKVNKITKWIASGEIGEVDTIEQVLEKAGLLLDKSCSEELFGQVIFEAEDSKVYVMNCEGTIGTINPEYLADVKKELKDG